MMIELSGESSMRAVLLAGVAMIASGAPAFAAALVPADI